MEDASPQEEAEYWEAHVARYPRDAAAWFNLGLRYKWMREWAKCRDANRTALDIEAEPQDPAWWNLGIAATALRDWRTARAAWRGFGIEGYEDSDAPPDTILGMTPVRLSHGEVVWGDRLDPARVIVRNVPMRDSGRRWGEIVLHDGAPNGNRTAGGHTYSVFDEIEPWSPSEIPTYRVDVRAAEIADVHELVDAFGNAGFAAEDWTASVRFICNACSEGTPGDHGHDDGFDPADAWPHEIGLAAPAHLARRLLEEWRTAASATRTYSEPELL